MTRFILLVGLLAAAACSGGGSPSSPAPQPGPRPSGGDKGPTPAPASKGGAILYRPTPGTIYAIDRRDSLTLELQGGNQVQQFARTAYLTVSIAEGGGGNYAATIRLDSLRQEEGATLSADSLLRAEGTTWTGTLSPQGRLGDLKADRASGVADQVGASLGVLFPVLPPGGLQGATAWSDTAERAIKTEAFAAKERAVTSYRLLKQEGQVYVVDAATGFQRTGTGGQAAQPMEMTSQGTRRTTYQFGADGLVASAQGADSAEMVISVPAVGQTVPVHQRASWKISKK